MQKQCNEQRLQFSRQRQETNHIVGLFADDLGNQRSRRNNRLTDSSSATVKAVRHQDKALPIPISG